jgi:hypothetical protein
MTSARNHRSHNRWFVRSICLVASLAFIFIAWNRVAAQNITTAVLGMVRDSTGASVVGAQVTVTNTDTNSSRSAPTNDLGEYRIDSLPVGHYQVSIRRPGFAEFVQKGVVLQLNVPTRLDVSLRLATMNGTVTVTGSMPIVNVTTAEIGRSIENNEIANMPLVNLNMTGLRNTGNILPNPDAIQEYRVETNNYDAQYGKMSSGVVTAITKSGTNAFHASLFDYWRNAALNANTWGSVTAKPPMRRNQFGGTLGGPIRKNKTFFFASYEGVRQLSSIFFTGATVPTAAERAGNLAGLVKALPAQFTCGSPSVICPSLLHPVAQKLLNPGNAAVSFPTVPIANVGLAGWQGAAASPLNTDEFLIKLDHSLTGNQRISASYFYTSGNNTVPPLNSATGLIEVEIRYDNRLLRLRVRDDGKGLDAKMLAAGGRDGHFGLHGMRERAQTIGGKLDVWTEVNSGTEIELSIPASKAYVAPPQARRSWPSAKLSRKGTAIES